MLIRHFSWNFEIIVFNKSKDRQLSYSLPKKNQISSCTIAKVWLDRRQQTKLPDSTEAVHSNANITLVNDRSLFCWFRSFSISRRNFASFTGNPPSSDTTEPGSKPTSSMNTLPNRSSESLQRPNNNSWDISWPIIDNGLWQKQSN